MPCNLCLLYTSRCVKETVLAHCLKHRAWTAGIFPSHIRLKHDSMGVHRIFFRIFPVAELTVLMINTNRRFLNTRSKIYKFFYCFFYFSHITVSFLKKSGKILFWDFPELSQLLCAQHSSSKTCLFRLFLHILNIFENEVRILYKKCRLSCHTFPHLSAYREAPAEDYTLLHLFEAFLSTGSNPQTREDVYKRQLSYTGQIQKNISFLFLI